MDPHFKPELPPPESIYHKDFHFLDEPLINKKYPSQPPSLTTKRAVTENKEILATPSFSNPPSQKVVSMV
jgi:hypothetical protein